MKRETMTLEKLQQIIAERGGRIDILADGTPVLRGLGKQATPALLRVVGYYRGELIKNLKGEK